MNLCVLKVVRYWLGIVDFHDCFLTWKVGLLRLFQTRATAIRQENEWMDLMFWVLPLSHRLSQSPGHLLDERLCTETAKNPITVTRPSDVLWEFGSSFLHSVFARSFCLIGVPLSEWIRTSVPRWCTVSFQLIHLAIAPFDLMISPGFCHDRLYFA